MFNFKHICGVGLLCMVISYCYSANVYVVFRYDDFRFMENPVQDSLMQICKEQQLPILLGVIPDTCDNVWQQTHSLNNNTTIALHGYKHININNEHSSLPLTEYCGLSYSEQKRKLEYGKNWIEQHIHTHTHTHIQVDYFIPPFNSCDKKTYLCLKSLGIHNISSSGISHCAYINNIPKTSELHTLKQDIEAVQNCANDCYLVCMMHEYDWTSNVFNSIVQWIAETENVKVLDIKDLSMQYKDKKISKVNNTVAFQFEEKTFAQRVKDCYHYVIAYVSYLYYSVTD